MASIKDLKLRESKNEEPMMYSSLGDRVKKSVQDINPEDFQRTWSDFFKENFTQIVVGTIAGVVSGLIVILFT